MNVNMFKLCKLKPLQAFPIKKVPLSKANTLKPKKFYKLILVGTKSARILIQSLGYSKFNRQRVWLKVTMSEKGSQSSFNIIQLYGLQNGMVQSPLLQKF